jgi:hypothetical protein
VPGIDLDALLHDYHYGVCNGSKPMKWQADWLLAKERTKRQRFLQFLQFVVTTIATLVFTPYSYFKRGRTTKSQKLIFQKTTVLLCLNSIQHMLLATLIDKLKVL